MCTNGAFGDVNYDGCVLDAPSAFSYSPASISVVSGEKVLSADPAVTGEVESFSIAPSNVGLSVNSRGVVSGVVIERGHDRVHDHSDEQRGLHDGDAERDDEWRRCTGVEGVDVADGDKMMEECPAGTVGEAFRVCTNGVLGVLDRTGYVVAPSDLSYNMVEYVATENNMFSTSCPLYNGTVSAFAIAPELPEGLSINTQNGGISGAPVLGKFEQCWQCGVHRDGVEREWRDDDRAGTIRVAPIMCEATEDLKAIAAVRR